MRGFSVGLAALVATAPVCAADVTFTGTLTGVCTLALSTPGVLGLATDGSLATSAGLPAVLAILSVGANTLTVNPPVWVSTPGTYTAATEEFQAGYLGLSGLGLADQVLTNVVTTRAINTLPLSLLTMNIRIDNSAGFGAGTYQAKVVVTCS
jgi:hypothetical protein